MWAHTPADNAPPPATRETPQSQPTIKRAPTYFERRRSVRYRETAVELVLTPGGRLRRFVVLHSKALRLALGQPKRREIEPLEARQEHFEFTTSELWAIGIEQAQRSLRLLYERVREVKASSPQATRERPQLPRPIGTALPALPASESIRGELLFAGKTDDALFCIEVLTERRVYRVEGLDLARALDVAEVKVGDTILIERAGQHQVAIREERTGSHGEGARTLRRGRETFVITKETPSEHRSVGASTNRSPRSSPGAIEHPLGDVA